MSTSEAREPEALDLGVWLIFNEANYRIQMNCVIELLVTQPGVFVTRTYHVQSRVSVPAFQAFWGWLVVGRERSLPEIPADECLALARELGITTTADLACLGGPDPCVRACVSDEIDRRFGGQWGALQDRVIALRPPAKSPGPPVPESPLRPQFGDAAEQQGHQDSLATSIE
jgi:hypothetical protein